MIETLKEYLHIIFGVLLLGTIVSFSIYVYVLKTQRNHARVDLAKAQQTIADYKASIQAAQKRADELAKEADENGIEDAKVIAALKAQIPSNEEEARKLAIEAASSIGGLK